MTTLPTRAEPRARLFGALALVLILLAVAGCGRKGDLEPPTGRLAPPAPTLPA